MLNVLVKLVTVPTHTYKKENAYYVYSVLNMLDCLTKHFQIYCCSICSSVFVFKRLERNKIGLRVPAAVSYLLVKVLTQCKKKRSEAKGIVGLESEFRKSIHFFYTLSI